MRLHHPLTWNGRERINGLKAAEMRAQGYTWTEITKRLPRSTGQRFDRRSVWKAAQPYLKGKSDG